MYVQGLDHFTIWTDDADRTRHFYCDIIGLREGARPNLGFPGIWLYSGDHPVVHVNIGQDVGHKPTGAFDHIAFRGMGDPQPLVERLGREGVDVKAQTVANGIRQVFCADPHGVRVEFNFPPADGR
jgi:catechol 2,3-dioxygenase-like lactoylglutathione lyase family enzyme